jgi:hypothetical protein
MSGGQGVAGSNPVSPNSGTSSQVKGLRRRSFYLRWSILRVHGALYSASARADRSAFRKMFSQLKADLMGREVVFADSFTRPPSPLMIEWVF